MSVLTKPFSCMEEKTAVVKWLLAPIIRSIDCAVFETLTSCEHDRAGWMHAVVCAILTQCSHKLPVSYYPRCCLSNSNYISLVVWLKLRLSNFFVFLFKRIYWTRKLCYRKDDRAMPLCDLYMDALKFSGLPDYAHRYYSQHFFMGFCSDRSYECSYKIWSP